MDEIFTKDNEIFLSVARTSSMIFFCDPIFVTKYKFSPLLATTTMQDTINTTARCKESIDLVSFGHASAPRIRGNCDVATLNRRKLVTHGTHLSLSFSAASINGFLLSSDILFHSWAIFFVTSSTDNSGNSTFMTWRRSVVKRTKPND